MRTSSWVGRKYASECFVIVQLPSHVRLFATPCTTALQASWSLPKFAQVQVYWIGDAIQPSHPLSPSSPSAFSLSQRASMSFPVSWLFPSGGQNIEALVCASVLQ